ncbi:hypothetical protein HYQ46_000123 [Verticillium longisporum]|nr:hypothetical protein HYQ46_000123 [Verticillium longisporum]
MDITPTRGITLPVPQPLLIRWTLPTSVRARYNPVKTQNVMTTPNPPASLASTMRDVTTSRAASLVDSHP